MEADRARGEGLGLPIAVAATLLLAGLVAIVLLAGADSGRDASPPAPECVSLWNGDRRALGDGSHNRQSHGYVEAQVVRLDRAGNPSSGGECAVVFPAKTLDPESFAAAKIHRAGGWQPLSATGVGDGRLAELQLEAVGAANVVLRPDGSLEPSV